MTVDEAISYLRKQMRELTETIYYAYVLDARAAPARRGVVPRAVHAPPRTRVARHHAHARSITIPEQMDQEAVATCSRRAACWRCRSSTPRAA